MGDAEAPSAKEIAGIIPLFFYDAIGRILPGAALIVGTFGFYNWKSSLSWADSLTALVPLEAGAGYILAVLLIFLGVAQVLGLLLASASHTFFEYVVPGILKPVGKFLTPLGKWTKHISDWPCELSIAKLQKHLGLTDLAELRRRYLEYFGSPLLDTDLNHASFVCGYYAWTIDPNLGLITARSDADALAARSLSLVFFILTLLRTGNHWLTGLDDGVAWWIWEAVLVLLFLVSASNFSHSRKKRVFDRFTVFLAATSESVKRLPEEK